MTRGECVAAVAIFIRKNRSPSGAAAERRNTGRRCLPGGGGALGKRGQRGGCRTERRDAANAATNREGGMILVTGGIVAWPETFDEVLRLSRDHVARSRLEPGCVSHAVHVDADNPLRLFFFEEWADAAALRAHFAVPESRQFVRAIRALIVETTGTRIWQAEPVARDSITAPAA